MICRYNNQLEWADGTVALFLKGVIDARDAHACGIFPPPYALILLLSLCNKPQAEHYLCEVDKAISKQQRQMVIETPVKPSIRKLPFPYVRCPEGHSVHTFLACDVGSSCFSNEFVSSDTMGLDSSCQVELRPLPPSFACSNGFGRVPYSLVCDHRHDCLDSSDEDFCDFAPCKGDRPLQCANSKQVSMSVQEPGSSCGLSSLCLLQTSFYFNTANL